MVIAFKRVWINRVRLPILLVVSLTGKKNIFLSPFASQKLVSRYGLGSPVPHLLISILGLNLVLTHGIPPDFRCDFYLFILTAIRHRVSPKFIGSRHCVPMAFTAESPPAKGPEVIKVPVTGAAVAGHHGPINVRLL